MQHFIGKSPWNQTAQFGYFFPVGSRLRCYRTLSCRLCWNCWSSASECISESFFTFPTLWSPLQRWEFAAVSQILIIANMKVSEWKSLGPFLCTDLQFRAPQSFLSFLLSFLFSLSRHRRSAEDRLDQRSAITQTVRTEPWAPLITTFINRTFLNSCRVFQTLRVTRSSTADAVPSINNRIYCISTLRNFRKCWLFVVINHSLQRSMEWFSFIRDQFSVHLWRLFMDEDSSSVQNYTGVPLASVLSPHLSSIYTKSQGSVIRSHFLSMLRWWHTAVLLALRGQYSIHSCSPFILNLRA